MENKLLKFLQNQFRDGFFWTKIVNPERISDPIVKAINDKEHEVLDPDSVSAPIVGALESLQSTIEQKKGIDTITVKNIQEAKADMTEVVKGLKAILDKKEKDVLIPKTDFTPVLKALEKIENNLPKMEKQEIIDYTMMFSQMCDIMETPHYKVELEQILEAINVVKDLKFPDFKFNARGELITEHAQRIFFDGKVQRVDGAYINPLTEETGQAIKDAVNNISIEADSINLNTDELETKLDTIAGKQLPNDHDVTVSNMIPAVETGLATETTLQSVQNAIENQVSSPNPTRPLDYFDVESSNLYTVRRYGDTTYGDQFSAGGATDFSKDKMFVDGALPYIYSLNVTPEYAEQGLFLIKLDRPRNIKNIRLISGSNSIAPGYAVHIGNRDTFNGYGMNLKDRLLNEIDAVTLNAEKETLTQYPVPRIKDRLIYSLANYAVEPSSRNVSVLPDDAVVDYVYTITKDGVETLPSTSYQPAYMQVDGTSPVVYLSSGYLGDAIFFVDGWKWNLYRSIGGAPYYQIASNLTDTFYIDYGVPNTATLPPVVEPTAFNYAPVNELNIPLAEEVYGDTIGIFLQRSYYYDGDTWNGISFSRFEIQTTTDNAVMVGHYEDAALGEAGRNKQVAIASTGHQLVDVAIQPTATTALGANDIYSVSGAYWYDGNYSIGLIDKNKFFNSVNSGGNAYILSSEAGNASDCTLTFSFNNTYKFNKVIITDNVYYGFTWVRIKDADNNTLYDDSNVRTEGNAPDSRYLAEIDIPLSAKPTNRLYVTLGGGEYNEPGNYQASFGNISFNTVFDFCSPLILSAIENIPVGTNINTGTKELSVASHGHVCTQNSTSTPLGINGVFTGGWQDTLDYSEIIVSIGTDVPSITDGLVIQWSSDGVNVDGDDVFSILSNADKTFTFPCQRQYVKLIYTNDGTAQTYFRLSTLLKRFASKGSSHRLKDTLVQEDDAIVTKSLVAGKTTAGGGAIVDVKVTPSGSLAVETTGTASVTEQDSPYIDAFGRKRVSSTGQRFDLEFIYSKRPGLVDEKIVTGATATHNANSRDVILAIVNTTTATEAALYSHYDIPYTAGNSQLIDVTGTLNNAAIAGGSASLFLRTKVTGTVAETTYAQAAWNKNIASTVDWSKSQILQMDFQSLKVGRIRFNLVRGGLPVNIHEITNDNLRASGYWQSPTLPIYWRIYNDADNTYAEMGYGDAENAIGIRYTLPKNALATMRAICATVKSEGGNDLAHVEGMHRSIDNGVTAKTVSTTLIPILSLQVAGTYNSIVNRMIALIENTEVSTDNPIRYAILYRPTLTNASFVAVDATESGMNYDVSATAVTGGTLIESGYVSSGVRAPASAQANLLGKTIMSLGRNGTSDIISICAIRTGSINASVLSAISWKEVR